MWKCPLCRLCESIIFGTNASHVFSSGNIPLIVGVIGGVVTRGALQSVGRPLLSSVVATALPGVESVSPVVEVEALMIGFSKAALPLSACSFPKDMSAG